MLQQFFLCYFSKLARIWTGIVNWSTGILTDLNSDLVWTISSNMALGEIVTNRFLKMETAI